MDDHPDRRSLGQGPVFHQVHPARDRLHNALATALLWLVFVLVMAAVPCVVALWRWAL